MRARLCLAPYVESIVEAMLCMDWVTTPSESPACRQLSVAAARCPTAAVDSLRPVSALVDLVVRPGWGPRSPRGRPRALARLRPSQCRALSTRRPPQRLPCRRRPRCSHRSRNSRNSRRAFTRGSRLRLPRRLAPTPCRRQVRAGSQEIGSGDSWAIAAAAAACAPAPLLLASAPSPSLPSRLCLRSFPTHRRPGGAAVPGTTARHLHPPARGARWGAAAGCRTIHPHCSGPPSVSTLLLPVHPGQRHTALLAAARCCALPAPLLTNRLLARCPLLCS